jgi:hypothetical protein
VPHKALLSVRFTTVAFLNGFQAPFSTKQRPVISMSGEHSHHLSVSEPLAAKPWHLRITDLRKKNVNFSVIAVASRSAVVTRDDDTAYVQVGFVYTKI